MTQDMSVVPLLWRKNSIIRLTTLHLIFVLFGSFALFPHKLKGGEERIAWTFNTSLGTAYCPPMPLIIKQSGYQDVRVRADYQTHSLRFPLYYSVKVGRQQKQRRWEGEFIHLKIDLYSRPEEIQRFEVSHGYNLLCLNHVRGWDKYRFYIGVGVVIAHPENEIRQQKLSQSRGILSSGYYLTGPVAQAGVSRAWRSVQSLRWVLEGKISVAYGKIPVRNGWATTPVIALQGLLGFELRYVP